MNFFAKIGLNLAKKIPDVNQTFESYIPKILYNVSLESSLIIRRSFAMYFAVSSYRFIVVISCRKFHRNILSWMVSANAVFTVVYHFIWVGQKAVLASPVNIFPLLLHKYFVTRWVSYFFCHQVGIIRVWPRNSIVTRWSGDNIFLLSDFKIRALGILRFTTICGRNFCTKQLWKPESVTVQTFLNVEVEVKMCREKKLITFSTRVKYYRCLALILV